MERLAHECAYERWHSMLFARFLAENHLLVEPELGAITLDECEELARDLDTDKWAMAVRCAHGMLPGVFRADHPAFSVPFAQEHRLRMEALLESLSEEVFVATDALGWVYQFWQSKRKNEVNRSEVKVGADELPAVTQLFTEPYMVAFLLDNGLGAWWAARRLTETDLLQSQTETELRRRASIDGVPLDYLRFARAEDGETTGAGWRIAAGDLDAWPDRLAVLRIMDPCCGSGHFLVAAFNMLVPMRMTLEDLTAREGVDAVLRDNLHGLELDARCVEIAAFALALAAWTYPGAEGYRSLPTLKLACSGLSVGATRERWTELAPSRERNLRTAFGWLHDAFRDAPVLGSLLNPSETEAAQIADRQSLAAVLRYALASETSNERHEAAVAAQGLAKARRTAGRTLPLAGDQRAISRAWQAGPSAARLLREAVSAFETGSGDRVSRAMPDDVRGRWACQPRVATELAVPDDVPPAPEEAVEHGTLAFGRKAGSGRVRDHHRRGRQGCSARSQPG